jgi:hypothetical protein
MSNHHSNYNIIIKKIEKLNILELLVIMNKYNKQKKTYFELFIKMPTNKEYDTKTILLIANVLAILFKNDNVQSHAINSENIKKFYRNKLNISDVFEKTLGKNTAQTLLKSLSYFVELNKPNYIEKILQAIDIFTNHPESAFLLHEEIIKIGDPETYNMTYNAKKKKPKKHQKTTNEEIYINNTNFQSVEKQTGSWNGINQSVQDAILHDPPKNEIEKQKIPAEKEIFNSGTFTKHAFYNNCYRAHNNSDNKTHRKQANSDENSCSDSEYSECYDEYDSEYDKKFYDNSYKGQQDTEYKEKNNNDETDNERIFLQEMLYEYHRIGYDRFVYIYGQDCFDALFS